MTLYVKCVTCPIILRSIADCQHRDLGTSASEAWLKVAWVLMETIADCPHQDVDSPDPGILKGSLRMPVPGMGHLWGLVHSLSLPYPEDWTGD